MDPALVRRLGSGPGWELLQSLPAYDEGQVLSRSAALRGAGADADLVAGLLTQSRLRGRAAAKLGPAAGQMLFTPDGLEQATRGELAARHAQRFAEAGVTRVWDLGCGIGADAMALAGAGMAVTAVEADPVTVAVARVNLRPWPAVAVVQARVEDVELPVAGAAHRAGAWLDPARRLAGPRDARGRARRVFRLDQLSPSWGTVLEVAARVPATGAKLSPGFPHGQIPAGAQAQWVSFGGEVLECALWWGELVESPGRSALVHTPGGWCQVTAEQAPTGAPPSVPSTDALGRWLYEPDKAVVQAGLAAVLAGAVQGAELDAGVGYVSSDQEHEVAWARRYEMLEVLPLHAKALRAWARGRGLGRLTIKKRGVPVDPDRLRAQLRLHGGGEATVVLTRVAGRSVALHVAPQGAGS